MGLTPACISSTRTGVFSQYRGQAILDVRDILHEIRGHLAARDPTTNQTFRGEELFNMSHELPLSRLLLVRKQAQGTMSLR